MAAREVLAVPVVVRAARRSPSPNQWVVEASMCWFERAAEQEEGSRARRHHRGDAVVPRASGSFTERQSTAERSKSLATSWVVPAGAGQLRERAETVQTRLWST